MTREMPAEGPDDPALLAPPFPKKKDSHSQFTSECR